MRSASLHIEPPEPRSPHQPLCLLRATSPAQRQLPTDGRPIQPRTVRAAPDARATKMALQSIARAESLRQPYSHHRLRWKYLQYTALPARPGTTPWTKLHPAAPAAATESVARF